MTAHVVPLISARVPMVRNPMLISVFGYPSARDPMEKATIPFPITRCPRVSIAVPGLVFDTRRGRRRIAYDVGTRRNKAGRKQHGGDSQRRQGRALQRFHNGTFSFKHERSCYYWLRKWPQTEIGGSAQLRRAPTAITQRFEGSLCTLSRGAVAH